MKAKKTTHRALVQFPTSLAAAAAVLLGLAGMRQAAAQDYGINLPPTQGTTADGAFQPGIYNWSYSNTQVHNTCYHFNMIRFPINYDTATDPASLVKLKGYIDQIPGNWAIICMFDTLENGQTGHGDGFPNNLDDLAYAWSQIDATFHNYPNVFYEIFNEPFGYGRGSSAASSYLSDMMYIMQTAGIYGNGRNILDGLGHADDIVDVANAGWGGMLAYHFYPSWVGSSPPTQSNFSNIAQNAIGGLSTRTWVTEFGADLQQNLHGYYDPSGCYDTYVDGNQPYSADVNCLRGLDDALRAIKTNHGSVRGAFVWHGWNNGDVYDYWSSQNAYGACKEHEIITHD